MKSRAQHLRETKIRQNLRDLRTGVWNDDPAAIVLEFSKMSHPPYKQIISALKTVQDTYIREQIIYFLSFVHRKSQSFKDSNGVYTYLDSLRPRHRRLKKSFEPLKALLRVFNNRGEANAVRAQTLEGFALINPPKKHPLWREVEKAVLSGLKDESVEVRFWACYAAGNIGSYRNFGIKSALPILEELAKNDKTLLKHWWYVAEEATDAIKAIKGVRGKPRTLINERKNKTLIKLFFENAREKRIAERQKR